MSQSLRSAFEKHQEFFAHQYVCDLTPNNTVSGFYILTSPSLRTTAAGKTFLNASLSDKTGSVSAIFWDYSGHINSTHDGQIVFLHGQIAEFKGAPQVSLDTIRLTEPSDDVDVSVLVQTAPIDTEKMYADIQALVASIEDSDYKAICNEFLRRHGDQFLSIPAAKSVHHSFLHGLLMHTGCMLKVADQLARLYAGTVQRDLLLTGTLLHDFSKREEFTFSSLGLVAGYSVKGDLLGHSVMGAEEVGEISRELGVPEQKAVLLQHLLLSHHGKPEFGAAVVPLCAESELLSMIDSIDSRMEIYRETMAQTPLGEFSNPVFALDGRRVYHHSDLNETK